ncbi:2-succinyl-5-enolpyruvyl-6-hydroxy-3-cyclohexene-1-carboxylate synthase [Natronomonas pharaonis DSM 2160]|uniref:2-succinyl-5-enolpyruvyl-6-hydroxy-3-cyclohexene-1-carboxylate synthase n=1 Tax=Natronomonas pharaonis (strain ATCC 35678 / DSM 2160 / CIP 103997 / JCM 8858 / NBRC 14720 / NCIMB 2260 / Gabara) TaxID=348780 RepID=MEND_NATPD|nr:RecName: Full=2-succinyl-5-enolpyruvyl-6-hydroxy-3-cyclohexene-1-carboxylate synthase; Short=SEPHCHC synthase; AltName: Full=Menaquinone biosynthesis protein MenD [Natronomonas pharaonis DSM 2160]CAI49454.1 2-succinyl-5-enolpyruvyl-6-hydroxy-3-cyclohexene-1-carboxylate synthase [Natronomonas pharaonis DSM 2160]
MATPNVNTLWGQTVADELATVGIETAVLAPGSRSTPLAVAFAQHDDIEAVSLLDERSAAFFALGYAKRTGQPAPLVCTSGTALANFHPAVIEADTARVPMVLLTADRPPELADSGANQTIDQADLYGDAVRSYRTLPEPEAAARKLRSLRTTLCRAVGTATGTEPGPVHLNVPFRKPLEPLAAAEPPAGVPDGAVPDGFATENPLAARGRDGPFVEVHSGCTDPSATTVDELATAVEAAASGLIVCGPTDRPAPDAESLVALADATGFSVFADPLSGLRFGPHVDDAPVCGGYDAYLPALEQTPEVVIRFGASPTSKPLRQYLRDADARQFIVDPAGGWREATFTATDLVVADETRLATAVADAVDRTPGSYADRLAELEPGYWRLVEGEEPQEGAMLADAVALAPDPSTVFVSNSMPVRDLDRFGAPQAASLSVLGNRGASGIDGIASTALGAGFGTDDPLVAVTGDLAYYHDMNGLLAVSRAGVDATIVCINNDGGGIFHVLPIEAHESFDKWFRTPHGLDFEPSAALYDIEFARTDSREGFRSLYSEAVGSGETQVIEVQTESGHNHADRTALREAVVEELGR